MADGDTLTLIVAEEPQAEPASQDAETQLMPVWVSRLVHRTQDVEIAPLQAELRKVQGQIDELLAGVQTSPVAGFELKTIEVSLAINAQGGIGIATAGVEASLALTFERA